MAKNPKCDLGLWAFFGQFLALRRLTSLSSETKYL